MSLSRYGAGLWMEKARKIRARFKKRPNGPAAIRAENKAYRKFKKKNPWAY